MTNWSRRFDEPIDLPDGRTINTIGEAAEYALDLPSKIGGTRPWQRAAEAHRKAAEYGARSFSWPASASTAPSMERQPIGNPEGKKKSHRWRSSRKLAADR
jgi:hypothetical protein